MLKEWHCRCSWAAPGLHRNWGDCQRSKNVHVAYCQSWKGADATRQKKWDKGLDTYAVTRKEGIQPDTTSRRDVDKAREWSDRWGVPYGVGSAGGIE